MCSFSVNGVLVKFAMGSLSLLRICVDTGKGSPHNREQQETQRCSQTYNGSPLSPTHGKCYSMCLVRCNYTCASLRLIVIANDKQKSVAAGKPARQINIKQFSNLVLDAGRDHVEDDEHDKDNDVVKDENAGK